MSIQESSPTLVWKVLDFYYQIPALCQVTPTQKMEIMAENNDTHWGLINEDWQNEGAKSVPGLEDTDKGTECLAYFSLTWHAWFDWGLILCVVWCVWDK